MRKVYRKTSFHERKNGYFLRSKVIPYFMIAESSYHKNYTQVKKNASY